MPLPQAEHGQDRLSRDMVLVGFGPLGIKAAQRFAALRDYFLPMWREMAEALADGAAESAAEGDALSPSSSPTESSRVVVGPAPEPVDVDLEVGSSNGSGDVLRPLPMDASGSAPLPAESTEPDLTLERVAYLCSGRLSPRLDSTVGSAPTPGTQEWEEWISHLWVYTQSVADEHRSALVVTLVDDDAAAQTDLETFFASWQSHRDAFELCLEYKSACLLLHDDDGVAGTRPRLPDGCVRFELTQRDEQRRLTSADDVVDQAALAVFGMWAGEGTAELVMSQPPAEAPPMLAIGTVMVCLPFADPEDERVVAHRLLRRFLDHKATVHEGYTASELTSGRLRLSPADISDAFMRVPIDVSNTRGDIRDELRVNHTPQVDYADRRSWADQLRNLRRLQIEATRPRLMRELQANYAAWKARLLDSADEVAEDILSRQAELPVARWALEKLNETASAVNMHQAGWGDGASTASRGDFDAATKNLEDAVADEPFVPAAVARYLLLAVALWPVLWVAFIAVLGESLSGGSERVLGVVLAVALIAAMLVFAVVSISRARRRIVEAYQAALLSLDEWLIQDLEACAADMVAKGLTGLHAHVERAIGHLAAFTVAHEELLASLDAGLGQLPRSPRVLALDEPPLNIVSVLETPLRPEAPDDVALVFLRTGQRLGWRTMSAERLRGRILATCRRASGRSEFESIEAALVSRQDSAERVLAVLQERSVVQAVPAESLEHVRSLVVGDPEHAVWERVRAAMEQGSLNVCSWSTDVPVAMFMKTRWSAVPQTQTAPAAERASDHA